MVSAARASLCVLLLSCSGASSPESARPGQELGAHDDVVAVASGSCEAPPGVPLVEGEACDALPEEIGAFRRVSCVEAVVPTGSATDYTGLEARYASGGGCVRAYALPISDEVRTTFHEGMYGDADTHRVGDGEVHLLDGVHAWLAHHHAYYVVSRGSGAGVSDLVSAMLAVFPDVSGPGRGIPTCAATGSVVERTVPPTPVAQLEQGASFATHYQGNRPSGARVAFPASHPLVATGLRPNEIVHVVDREIVHDRRAMADLFDRMTRPGRMDIVVSRARLRHARCIRLTIATAVAGLPDAGPRDAGVAALDAGVPDAGSPAPRQGRHCVRRSNECWDCVEFPFPAELGCRCRGRDICVRRQGADQCLGPTRVCCMTGTGCNSPPGCEGVASSCSADTPGGRNEACTFLSTCPTPLPTRTR